MSLDQKFPRVEPWSQQRCPFCGDDKIIITHGITLSETDDDKMKIYPDRGYSFCNCKSVWFTNWTNIDLDVRSLKDSTEVLQYYIKKDRIRNNGYKKNSVMSVGDDKVEKEFDRLGFDTTLKDRYDLIWAYHSIKHEKNPLQVLRTYYNILNDKGILFIAMPDPYFIDFGSPYQWRHWILRKNHIMWDMDSFCEELETIGFKVLMKERNIKIRPMKDFHVICQVPK